MSAPPGCADADEPQNFVAGDRLVLEQRSGHEVEAVSVLDQKIPAVALSLHEDPADLVVDKLLGCPEKFFDCIMSSPRNTGP